MKQQIHLYWFSGSGNTFLAASAFSERLRQLGWTVEMRPLERSDPKTLDAESVLGLAFPTHCFAIPEIVLSFVRSLPQVESTAAMMLGTHGAFSGGVVGPLKRELTAKGFRCQAARILAMPDSFFPFFSDATNQRKIERALSGAERYADDFASGTTRWRRWAILSDIHSAIFGGFFASRKWCGKYHSTIHARKELCTHCDVCVQCCPVSALESQGDAPPRPQKNCTNCLRCVAICPTNAMRHMVGFRPYRSEEASLLKHRFDNVLSSTHHPRVGRGLEE